MTWPATRRRLLVAMGTLVAVVLILATTATRTVAAWTDGAVFAARATSGTWATLGGDSCEVLNPTTGEVVGTCSVDGVTFTGAWAQGTRFSVAVGGFQPSNDRVARVSVDLSQYSSEWNWATGFAQMDSAQNVSWSAPVITFTTYPWGFSPFTGTYMQGASRTGPPSAGGPEDSAGGSESAQPDGPSRPEDPADESEPESAQPDGPSRPEDPADESEPESAQPDGPSRPEDPADESEPESAEPDGAASRP